MGVRGSFSSVQFGPTLCIDGNNIGRLVSHNRVAALHRHRGQRFCWYIIINVKTGIQDHGTIARFLKNRAIVPWSFIPLVEKNRSIMPWHYSPDFALVRAIMPPL